MAGVKWETLLVYLDDNIVFSNPDHDNIQTLREVFALLAKSGISLEDSKCHLFQ